ncbi:MAG: fumarate reductase cytochrome b subunit, partial [Saezia sp.]
MSNDNVLITQSNLDERVKKSRIPAKLDLYQSLSGLFLGLFMWGHMFFVSSILFGKDAMWHITKFFEGYHVLGTAYPRLVSIIVAIVFFVFIVHAMLAVRKFPISYKQYKTYRAHMKAMDHQDTTFWMWQVWSGFALFFLASAHLYQMLIYPDLIGPSGSGDRMWTRGLWPYYLVMLLAVEFHGGIGLYRLAVKWCIPSTVKRETLKTIKWAITGFF